MIVLAIRTGIPMSEWERDPRAIRTAFALLNEQDERQREANRSDGQGWSG